MREYLDKLENFMKPNSNTKSAERCFVSFSDWIIEGQKTKLRHNIRQRCPAEMDAEVVEQLLWRYPTRPMLIPKKDIDSTSTRTSYTSGSTSFTTTTATTATALRRSKNKNKRMSRTKINKEEQH